MASDEISNLCSGVELQCQTKKLMQRTALVDDQTSMYTTEYFNIWCSDQGYTKGTTPP